MFNVYYCDGQQNARSNEIDNYDTHGEKWSKWNGCERTYGTSDAIIS